MSINHNNYVRYEGKANNFTKKTCPGGGTQTHDTLQSRHHLKYIHTYTRAAQQTGLGLGRGLYHRRYIHTYTRAAQQTGLWLGRGLYHRRYIHTYTRAAQQTGLKIYIVTNTLKATLHACVL